LIQAAKCGHGLANVPRMLARDDLISGTLAAPHLSRRPDTFKLVDWLSYELRQEQPTAER